LRPPVFRGPSRESRSVLLGERAERGERPQSGAMLAPVALEGLVPGEGRPQLLQRLALELPHPIAIDAALSVERVSGGGKALEIDAGRRRSGYLLDAEEERIAITTTARIVGTRLHRRDQRGRGERIDQQEPGAQYGRGPPGDPAEIGEITDAPALAR